MKKLLSLLLLLLAVIPLSSCAAKSPETLRQYVVTLSDPFFGTFCTGVAIGEHEVMTANHCVDVPMILLNGVWSPEDRVIAYDGADTVVIRTKQRFKHWTNVSLRSPRIGERMQIMGHVLGGPMMYREGYLSGIVVDEKWYKGNTVYVWDVQAAGGDSGGGVFDKRGNVLCTVSHGVLDREHWPHFALMGCYAPKFTTEQWKLIKNG